MESGRIVLGCVGSRWVNANSDSNSHQDIDYFSAVDTDSLPIACIASGSRGYTTARVALGPAFLGHCF